MTTDELLSMLARTLTEHLKLPEGYDWAPTAGLAALTLFGLLLIVRGARWAPALGGMAFGALGGLAGSYASVAFALPLWPTVGVCGVGGLLLGIVAFRLWQALLLAGCCAAIGIAVYYVRVLTPHVSSWLQGDFDGNWIELQPAGSVTQSTSAASELANLWSYLASTVPNFTPSFLGITAMTAAAGLVFGLLLPRASRALWAATLGVLLAGAGTAGLMQRYAPDALNFLLQNGGWSWSVVAVVWLFALAYNVASTGKRPAQSADDAGGAPAVRAA